MNVPHYWLSSLPSIFETAPRRESNPRRIIVSLYPLSALHLGQVFVRASSPLNHEFTHSSHPRRVLQHFVTITGGFYTSTDATLETVIHGFLYSKGYFWQTLFPPLYFVLMLYCPEWPYGCLPSLTAVAFLAGGGSKSLSELDESPSYFEGTANIFRLGAFQKLSPIK